MNANNITINFAKNPELKEAFSLKEPGDTCSFSIEMQVNEQDQDEVRGTIKKIELEAHEDYGEDKTVEPKPDEPVMVVMAAAKSKRKEKVTPIEY